MLPSSTSVTGQTGLSIGVSRLKWKGRRLPCVAWELCDDGPLSDPTMRDVGANARCYSKARGKVRGNCTYPHQHRRLSPPFLWIPADPWFVIDPPRPGSHTTMHLA